MELKTQKDGISYVVYAAGEYRITDAHATPKRAETYFSQLEQTLRKLDNDSFKNELEQFHLILFETLRERNDYTNKQRVLMRNVMGGSGLLLATGGFAVHAYAPALTYVFGGMSTLLLIAGAAGVAQVMGHQSVQEIALKLAQDAPENTWRHVLRKREALLLDQLRRYRSP